MTHEAQRKSLTIYDFLTFIELNVIKIIRVTSNTEWRTFSLSNS